MILHGLAATAALTLLTLAACTSADPAPPRPSSASVPVTAKLEDFALRAGEEGATAVLWHVRNGDQVRAQAFGVKDLLSREAAGATDRLWISGAGTPMLAVSVMKLAEQDRVSLDAPVSNYLPEFSTIFPAWHATTIRELLGSRTGLPDYVPLLATMPAERLQTTTLTFEQRLRTAASGGAKPKPVLEVTWSATDWEVLAWLLERIHGRPLAEILDVDVFEPAGMTDTLVAAPGPQPEPMLHAYVLSGGNRLDFTRIDAFAGSGDAGIVSTVEDVNKFFTALTAGQLIRQETWQEMIEASPYELGGIQTKGDICPDTRHVLTAGGGGPYAILSRISLDGRHQASVATALPPMELDSTRIPPLVTQMEDALNSTMSAICP